MNCLKAEGLSLVNGLKQAVTANEVVICPPFTLLSTIGEVLKGSGIKLGAQDCHMEEKGAFTGDVSATMLSDIGAKYVIVGHSERRKQHNETCDVVKAKALVAIKAGLIPIICMGETLEERKSDKTESVLLRQINDGIPEIEADKYVIAYEPIWAIGTGMTAKSEEIKHAHAFIGSKKSAKILYGGSVNDQNYKEICSISGVSGLLVGGASLDGAKFSKIMAV